MNIHITSTDDFIRALRENQEFLAAARREILTEELLELPNRFALNSKQVEGRFGDVEGRFDDIDKEFGQVKGITFGIDLERTGLPRMVANFDLRRVRVVRLAEHNRASEEFNDAVWDARDNGKITKQQYNRLMVTDLIARGRLGRSSDTHAYIVAEASYELEPADLEKIRSSRESITKVFPGAPVFACLYAVHVSSDLRDAAERDDVRVFIEEEAIGTAQSV